MARILSELNCASSAVRCRKSIVPRSVFDLPGIAPIEAPSDAASSASSSPSDPLSCRKKDSSALILPFDFFGWPPAELFRLRKRDAGWSFRCKGLRHFFTDGDTDGRISAGATIIEIASEPAFAFISVRVRRGLPDFRRTKMRSVRVGITNALHDAQVTFVEERFQAG